MVVHEKDDPLGDGQTFWSAQGIRSLFGPDLAWTWCRLGFNDLLLAKKKAGQQQSAIKVA